LTSRDGKQMDEKKKWLKVKTCWVCWKKWEEKRRHLMDGSRAYVLISIHAVTSKLRVPSPCLPAKVVTWRKEEHRDHIDGKEPRLVPQQQ
jgi:hypothetical protein